VRGNVHTNGLEHFWSLLKRGIRGTYVIRALAAFGIRDLLLTSAAGGINRKFCVGDFMVLTAYINLMGVNSLRGKATPRLPGFVDMTNVYDKASSACLFRAEEVGHLRLRRGVYLAVSGPSYETPAEIRAVARLGADTVGMSTVPEAIVARQCRLNVAAVACITNPATGPGKGRLSHLEVLKIAKKVKLLAVELLKHFAHPYDQS